MNYKANEFQVVTGLVINIDLEDEDLAKLLSGGQISNDSFYPDQKVLFTIKRKSKEVTKE